MKDTVRRLGVHVHVLVLECFKVLLYLLQQFLGLNMVGIYFQRLLDGFIAFVKATNLREMKQK